MATIWKKKQKNILKYSSYGECSSHLTETLALFQLLYQLRKGVFTRVRKSLAMKLQQTEVTADCAYFPAGIWLILSVNFPTSPIDCLHCFVHLRQIKIIINKPWNKSDVNLSLLFECLLYMFYVCKMCMFCIVFNFCKISFSEKPWGVTVRLTGL